MIMFVLLQACRAREVKRQKGAQEVDLRDASRWARAKVNNAPGEENGNIV